LNQDNKVEQDKILALLMEQPIAEITQKLPPAMQTLLGSSMLEPAKSKRKTKQNQKKGVVLLEAATKAGEVIAYNELGFHFARTNFKKAAEYWQQGAEANNSDAMFMYGLYLELYERNAENKKKTIPLFKKAAEVNHPGALFLLGIEELFNERLKGEGSEQTPNYLMLAIEQANEQLKSKNPDFVVSYMVRYKALHAVGVFLIDMNRFIPEDSPQYEQNRLAAHEYWRQSAGLGYHKAQFDLGIGLIGNYGSFQEGIDWLNKAAEQDDERAKQVLALYKTQEHFPVTSVEAFNTKLTAIIQQNIEGELMGFSKKDFNTIVEAYFGHYSNLRLDHSKKRKEERQSKAEEVVPPETQPNYPNSTQTQQEEISHSPKKISELIVMHSSLFHDEKASSSCSSSQYEKDISSIAIEIETTMTSTNNPIEETNTITHPHDSLQDEQKGSWYSIQSNGSE
jgi:TPR repeat protein